MRGLCYHNRVSHVHAPHWATITVMFGPGRDGHRLRSLTEGSMNLQDES